MACPFLLVSLATNWGEQFGEQKQSVNFIEQGYLFAILIGYLLRDAYSSEDKNNLWILLNRGVFLSFSSATTWRMFYKIPFETMPLGVIITSENRIMKRGSFLHIAPWRSQ